MLSSIAAITIPLLLLMFVTFFVFEHNRKKRLAQHKLALNGLISDLKQSYKLDVTTLSEEGQLSNSQREKLYMIANNFFVYQAINEESVGLFEISLKKLSHSFSSGISYIEQGGEVEDVQERVELFISNLPTHARGFNGSFYQGSLTAINQLLEMPELELESDDSDFQGTHASESTEMNSDQEDSSELVNSQSA